MRVHIDCACSDDLLPYVPYVQLLGMWRKLTIETMKILFVDNLMLGVQLADVSTRCSSHPQDKSEARCEIDGNL